MANSGALMWKRIRLVPFSSDFLGERYVSWLNDPEVVRFSEQRFRVHTYESCREYMDSFEGTPNYFWGVTIDDGARHIGNMNASVDEKNLTGDVGVLIGEKSCWGKGYGFEAYEAAVDFLLRKVCLRKITAGTMELNKGMLRIMEKLHMKPDGRRRRHVLYNGRPVDVVHMAVFREEWYLS